MRVTPTGNIILPSFVQGRDTDDGIVFELSPEYRKVIEAAKVALEWVDGCEEFEDAMGLLDACKGVEAALRPTVEALEKAEAGYG